MQKKRKAARQRQAAATPFWATPSFVRAALVILSLAAYVNTIPGQPLPQFCIGAVVVRGIKFGRTGHVVAAIKTVE